MRAVRRFVLQLLLLFASKILVFCENRPIDFLQPRNDSDGAGASSQLLFNTKSHVDKFADSWRYYAKANDIAKREKLRMALKDALHSIEKPQKHSIVASVDSNSIKRLKQAAILLKEFKQMYSLSQNVKRTLGVYQQAKSNLTTKLSEDGDSKNMNILKRFLVAHDLKDNDAENKRDRIPSYITQKSFIDRTIDEAKELNEDSEVDKPMYLKRTSKVSVKGSPLENGGIGIEYAATDPRYQNIEQAVKAIRAAKIIFKYTETDRKSMQSEEYASEVNNRGMKDTTAARKSSFPFPQRHGLGLSTFTTPGDMERPETKTFVSTSNLDDVKTGVASVVESLVNGDEELPDEDKAAIESLGKGAGVETGQFNRPVAFEEAQVNVKKEVVNRYVGQLKKLYARYLKVKEENDTVENALQFQNEIINSSLGNVSRSLLNNLTLTSSSELKGATSTAEKSKTKEMTNNEKEMDNDEKEKNAAKQPVNDESLTKQEDTLRQLKEAKLARERYEVAKHELAHKIKELYVLANNYEKDETENQILEVKNLISHKPGSKGKIIPGSRAYDKSSIQQEDEKTTLESSDNIIKERDNVHPGMGLAEVQEHDSSKLLLDGDDEHQGFTMGAIAKPVHEVESEPHDIDKKNVRKAYEYLHLPIDKKPKSDDKADDETLSIIAQAIQEDMKEIRKDKNKDGVSLVNPTNKVMLLNISDGHNKDGAETAEKEHKEKEVKQELPTTTYSTDNVDEYLTKALSDIISQDNNQVASVTPSLSVNEIATDGTIDELKAEDAEHNKNVVEKAMKQHAINPNLPLPLIDTKGDKIKLNPAINSTAAENVTPETTPVPEATPKPAAETQLATPPAAPEAPQQNSEDSRPLQASTNPLPPAQPQLPPNDVVLHVSDKNITTALAEIDLHDPDNKRLLDKASHMEESIAEAQDQLYRASEKDDGQSVEDHKGIASHNSDSKDKDKEHKEDTSSRTTLTTTADSESAPLPSTIKSSPTPEAIEEGRPFFRHQTLDPYGSIQEHAAVSNHMQLPLDVAEDGDSEGAAFETDVPHRHHHHHHHHRRHHHHQEEPDEPDDEPEPDPDEEDDGRDDDDDDPDAPEDDDDDEDDDEDEKDKRHHIKYHDHMGNKRSLNNTGGNSSLANRTVGNSTDAAAVPTKRNFENLEDEKRSGIPSTKKNKTKAPNSNKKKNKEDLKKKLIPHKQQKTDVPKTENTTKSNEKSIKTDQIDKDAHNETTNRIEELEDVKRSSIPHANTRSNIQKFMGRKRKAAIPSNNSRNKYHMKKAAIEKASYKPQRKIYFMKRFIPETSHTLGKVMRS